MIAAVIVLALMVVALGAVMIRDEITYQDGFKEGYAQGYADHRELERAKADAGLRSVGIVRPFCPRGGECVWPACSDELEGAWADCPLERATVES